MRYHTTLSTIIVSMGILLIFAAVAIFCVETLHITSPGLMLLNSATERLRSEELPFSLSFSSIDRIMDKEIIIHDANFEIEESNRIRVETVRVTQNPVSILSKMIRKQGSIRLELDNVDIVHDISNDKGPSDSDGADGNLDIDALLDEIAALIEKRTSGYIYNFDYEIVLNSADIHVGDEIEIQDCYSELKIDRGLVLRNIYFDIPSFTIARDDATISLENFVASIDRTDRYNVDASFENLEVVMDEKRASIERVSAVSRFTSLADIEIKHFPFEGRLEAIHFENGNTRMDIASIEADSEDVTMKGAVNSLKLEMADFKARTDRVDATLIGDITSDYQLSIDTSAPIAVDYRDSSLVTFKGYSSSLHYNGIYTMDASLKSVDIPYISSVSSELIDNINLSDNTLSLQYNNRTLYAELLSSLVLDSGKNYIDNTSADFRLGFIIDDGKVGEVFFDLDRLNLPAIKLPVTGHLNYRDERLSGRFSYSDSFVLSLNRKFGTRVNAEITSLNLVEIEPLISMITPVFRNYIAPETTLSGTFRLTSDGQILEDSSVYSSLALSNIRFNDYRFGLAGMLQSNIKDRIVNVEALSMTSEYLRATYSGSISLSTLLPEGHFELANPETGKEYFTTDILLNENKAYLFNANLPTVYDSSISGIVERKRDRSINASGTLASGISTYPISLLVDPIKGLARVSTDGFLFSFDILNNIIATTVEFSTFKTPVRSVEIDPLIINGSLSMTFNFEDQRISGSTGGVDLIGFRFLPSDPSIHFAVEFTNDHVAINDIYILDDYPLMSGRFYVDQKNGAMAGHLGNDEEKIDISIMKRDKEYSGIIDVENLKLDRYNFENISINSSLVGRGSNLDEFTFSGSMAASPQSAMEYGLRSDIILTSDSLKLNNFDFTTETLTVHSDTISFDTLSGNMSSKTDVRKIIQNKDRDYPVDLNFSVSTKIPTYENFIDLVFNLGDYLESGGFADASIHLDNFSLDNGISIRNRDIELSFGTEGFTAKGNLLNGSYDFESRAMDLTILDNEIFSGHFKGSVRLPEYDMEIENMKFNLHTLVTFMKYPIFYFGSDSFACADLRVYGKGMNTHIFGDVYSDKVEMRTWWVDQDYFVATNIKMTIIDNELDSGFMPVAVINNESGAVREGRGRFYGILGGPNFVDHIAMDAHVDKDGMFHIICPISSYNAQIEGWGWGDFTYNSELWLQHLSGDLYIQDFDIYMGMDPLPYWWESYMQFTDDFIVRFANNVRFIMPKGENPIMTAYINEGDSIHFTYDTRYRNASIDGNINLKGGEIYYINKNFYITEGSFNFPAQTFKEPRLSLRARLTDFDSNGDKVDIYLVLNNSTLDNINPHFESSPQKSMEEIMTILGNAIISNEENSTFGNLSSVATLVTSGMGAMGKGELITSNFSTRSLTDSIRESLHLDMFSMRTQLLQNVLLDSFFPGDTVYSPMSRYFNNTTVFFGKQVTDAIFMQGLIRLNSKEKRKNKNPFLTDDLLLDFEVSLEWENPIGTVSFFTTPVNLLPYNMFENFGISYRKRLVF